MKIYFIILATIFLIIMGIYFSRYIGYKSVYRSYQTISELKDHESYTIKKLTGKELYYQSGLRFADTGKDDSGSPGYIYYDTLQHNLWVETTERLDRKDGHLPYPFEEWLNIDLNGNTIAVKPDSSMLKAPGVVLKSDISNTYKWDDLKTQFYLEFFFKEKFNWSSLNPFKGIGSLNGASSHTWKGMAYFKLLMQKNAIHFRINTANITNYQMELYRLPPQYTDRETVLLYIHDKYFDKKETGLYLITGKSKN
ncbi:hypothetical protein F0L74_15250 [Chitinophaga agrisoli]|uniref:Uncharacterized protein n=1 Tax=Chitinophaga agrisoli TaxID=2607653 RepID=A0A5B2W0P1_9BACT|nr:hypothetical protein [Chitinophaga agrisoli]KAA2243829.1 hypothetical protein F0L74_15250 [Chitinophaga agrisoli]